MLRFTKYLSTSFIYIWLGVVFAFLALLGLLDSLANGDEIMAAQGAKFSDTFRYMAYRLPVIFDRIYIFTIVLAILFVFVRLIRAHELVALLGFGLSASRQIALMTPVVLGATILSIIIINLTLPPSVRALQSWGIGEYKVRGVSEKNPLWMQDGLDIVKASSRYSWNSLGDLQIFKRDKDGYITDAIRAARADYDGQTWQLQDAAIIEIAGTHGQPRMARPALKGMVWRSAHNPATIARLSADPRDLSLSDMRNFREKGNSGSKPRFAYGYWYTHRLSRPLAALTLLICCVPLMQKTRRQDTGDLSLIIGITMTFIYLIIDAAMATFANNGTLAVNSAIFMPIVVFLLFGIYLCLRTETLPRPGNG